MATVDVKLTTTNFLGKKSTKTITDINPEAGATQIRSLVQGLVGLTTNTYDSAKRVETTDIDTEAYRQIATITPEETTVGISKAAMLDDGKTISFTYNGNAPVNSFTSTYSIANPNIAAIFVNDGGQLKMIVKGGTGSQSIENGTLTIKAPQTDTYTAATAQINFTFV